MKLIREDNASNFIFFNAVLYGSSYVWLKIFLSNIPRFSGLLLANGIGAAVILVLFRKSLKSLTMANIKTYTGIVIFCTLSNVFNAVGLQYTSSANVAFITQMSVVIVPVIMAVLDRKRPEGYVMISAVLSAVGLLLLTIDFSTFTLSIGDLYSFGAAFTFSVYLIHLNKSSGKIDSLKLTVIYFVMNIMVYSALAFVFREEGFMRAPFGDVFFIVILFLVVSINILTVVFQNEAAKYVNPEKTAVIYCFEPVVTMIVAYLVMSEIPALKCLIGSAFIVFSIIYMNFRSKAPPCIESGSIDTKSEFF